MILSRRQPAGIINQVWLRFLCAGNAESQWWNEKILAGPDTIGHSKWNIYTHRCITSRLRKGQWIPETESETALVERTARKTVISFEQRVTQYDSLKAHFFSCHPSAVSFGWTTKRGLVLISAPSNLLHHASKLSYSFFLLSSLGWYRVDSLDLAGCAQSSR